ncbi:VOC family protein [Nostocales cyanobacterium LEGE 12452]|nr:VOC family protein [Nostocales cyanobacterium LEGE 12452]
MSSVIPIFRIFDIPKTLEFYVDWLGFTVDWEHRYGENFPIYMQVSKDDIVFHLSEHYGDACPGSKVYIEYTGDLQAYQKELSRKDYRYYKPCVEKEPGGVTMELIDPFGNKILFSAKKEQG